MTAPALDPVEAEQTGRDDERRWYTIAVTKNPEGARDRVRDLLADGRDFYDCIGADTAQDDPRFPVGANCLYALPLTAAEAADLEQGGESTGAGNNVRSVDLSVAAEPHTAPTPIPGESTLRYLRADAASVDTSIWHGRDVTVLVMDQGTTQAVRDRMGWTLVGRQNFGDVPANGAELHPATDGRASGLQDHGCLVAPNAVPAGGRILDAMVITADGRSSPAMFAAALRWGVDQGAKIANFSFGQIGGTSQAYADALAYAANAGVEVFISAGNEGQNTIASPASYSGQFPSVHSVIAFDENTNNRAVFGGASTPSSNYAATASGCAAGRDVTSLSPTAATLLWSGTSCASPCAASDCAKGCTGGRFTPRQVGAALKANLRDTGQLPLYQGGGAYDLRRALTALGAMPTPGPRRNPSTNPSLEVSATTGHTAGTGDGTWVAPTRQATGGRTGDAWASYTATAATVWFYGPGQPVVPGVTMTPSVFVRRSASSDPNTGSATKYSRCHLAFYNSAGAVLSYSAAPGIHSPAADTWHRVSATGVVVPAGAVTARTLLYITDSAAGEVIGLDGWLPEAGTNVEPYFDGSSPGAVWAGTPHASPSTLVSTSAPPRPGALLLGA